MYVPEPPGRPVPLLPQHGRRGGELMALPVVLACSWYWLALYGLAAVALVAWRAR